MTPRAPLLSWDRRSRLSPQGRRARAPAWDFGDGLEEFSGQERGQEFLRSVVKLQRVQRPVTRRMEPLAAMGARAPHRERQEVAMRGLTGFVRRNTIPPGSASFHAFADLLQVARCRK